MRYTFATFIFWILSPLTVLAAAESGHHALPLDAQRLHEIFPITNSMIMVWVAVGLIVLFCRAATRKMALVPAGFQNFAEWVIESLYDFLEGLMGAHLTKRTFWFFGSVFFFILVSNYLGLIPGVGTVGWDTLDAHGHKGFLPWLRGANADINMTAAMSFSFAILWLYWALTENNLRGFLAHIFAPKGNFEGVMLMLMIPVFLFVGVLEVISIAIRPVALTFRLYGNIYGGEQTLESLMNLIPTSLQKFLSWLPALPFYFMELLVGFVQALVFTLLCAIFLKLICDHGEEEHH
ncbi:MAG: F0F1 ATP synthase subunit A [Akkermansiaceae bacterium]|nr:F0F1 ATP synthase subunit A [Akkermansiaceae bacterium]